MFSLSAGHRFLLFSQPTDMRKSFDGLSGLIQNKLHRDPRNGEVFIFVNKSKNKIKLLHWSSGSFVLYYKRLEKGSFELPNYGKNVGSIKLDYARMVMIMDGLSVQNLTQRKRYKSPVKQH